MNNYSLYKINFLSNRHLCITIMFIVVTALCFFSHMSIAQNIPIPRKRPRILNVSPSYIKELKNRKNINYINNIAPSLNKITPATNNEEINKISSDQVIESEGISNTIENIDKNSLLAALEDSRDHRKYNTKGKTLHSSDNYITHNEIIPIPRSKPNYTEDQLQPKALPISSNNNSSNLKLNTNKEMALVSFALTPNQITLDDNLKQFLLEHAIKMFKKDPNLTMEIHAYASSEDGKEYSDVRKSLARALEVRSFLLEQNIDPSRLKLTPFGQDKNNSSDNRIDLLFIAVK